jgi:hypothetical protein
MEHQSGPVRLMKQIEFLNQIAGTTASYKHKAGYDMEAETITIRFTSWHLALGSHIVLAYKNEKTKEEGVYDLDDLKRLALDTKVVFNKSASFRHSCTMYDELPS